MRSDSLRGRDFTSLSRAWSIGPALECGRTRARDVEPTSRTISRARGVGIDRGMTRRRAGARAGVAGRRDAPARAWAG